MGDHMENTHYHCQQAVLARQLVSHVEGNRFRCQEDQEDMMLARKMVDHKEYIHSLWDNNREKVVERAFHFRYSNTEGEPDTAEVEVVVVESEDIHYH